MQSDAFPKRFIARFSDGKTAASRDAEAWIAPSGVAILSAGEREPLIWRYETLDSGEPLSRHSIDALLSSRDQPGATLFVTDPAFARDLAQHAPHLGAGAQRFRSARPWIAAAVVLVLIATGVSLAGLSPARSIARLLPDSARAALGDQVVTSMTEQRRTCDAPAGRAALDRLTARLSEAAGNDRTFKVIVVDWGLLNAFATPGERIVLTRGLIAKAKGPDEIAGVLAHEMGHGLELHPETGLVRGLGMAASLELMLGGSGGTLANVGLILAQLSYSREAEREADEQALRLLRAAGISNAGLIDFFDRVTELERKDGKGGAIERYDVLRSHPQTVERRERVAREPAYTSTPSLSPQDWAALKSICGSEPSPSGTRREPAVEREI